MVKLKHVVLSKLHTEEEADDGGDIDDEGNSDDAGNVDDGIVVDAPCPERMQDKPPVSNNKKRAKAGECIASRRKRQRSFASRKGKSIYSRP